MPNELTMSAALDRKLAWDRGDSRRYLRVRLDAGPAPVASRRPPMNLVLTVDASGSMHGERIVAARQAARGVLAALQGDDLLTVASFAGETVIHLAARPMDAAGKAMACAQIDSIDTRGNTDLSNGWFQSVIAATDEGAPGDRSTRVILLSDGQANAGITSHSELARHASELLARGVTTSALGIGDDYDEQLLGGIAEAGGGRLLDAETSTEIETVLVAEVGAAALTAADALQLTLTLPPQTMAEPLGSTAARRTLNGMVIPLGALLYGNPRDVYVGLTLPAGEAGDSLVISARLTGRATARNAPLSPLQSEVRVVFAGADANTPQPRDIDLSMGAAEAWMAHMLRRMADLNAAGDRASAVDYVETQSRYFNRYLHGLPGAENLLEQIAALRQRASSAWDARTRKEMHYHSRRNFNMSEDFRGANKASWLDHLNRN